MIEDRGWEPLTERRAKAKAITAFKILKKPIDIPRERFRQYIINYTRSQTTLLVPYCHTNIYEYSYFQNAAKV